MASSTRRFSGHLRTIGHLCRNLVRPPSPPPAERWVGELEDPASGRIEVTGWLSRAGLGRTLVILVHGLGGSADSPYLCRAARVADGRGLDSLRLNLRGADPSAGDFYHGGLTTELHAAVADPAFAGYDRIAVLGYSMGGHVALRYAAEVKSGRVSGVAAICSPLHLRPVSEEFDRPSRRLYRYWVLRHLRRCFAELEAAGTRLPNPFESIGRARSFREWDDLTVVPRFGFSSADDYYSQASAAAVIGRLRVPCLLVASEIDPVITPRAIEPYLPPDAEVGAISGEPGAVATRPAFEGRPAPLTVLWHPAAGHVAFPAEVDLEGRLLDWLSAAELSKTPFAGRAVE